MWIYILEMTKNMSSGTKLLQHSNMKYVIYHKSITVDKFKDLYRSLYSKPLQSGTMTHQDFCCFFRLNYTSVFCSLAL